MIYRFLKIIVGVGIRFYYKEVKILHSKSLSSDGPLIIIANHPNTLMDAMMIGFACKQPIYFMAKGTLFNSKLKLKLLQKLNMIPINRVGEKATKGVSNQDSFEACYRVLEEGKTLVIFPEGTSFSERHLRELKPGTARIALESEKRNKGKLNLRIVPLGLNYLKAEKFRSSVLIDIGKQIRVVDYLDKFQQDASKTSKKLTEKFRVSLEHLLVNSESKEEENLVDDLTNVLTSKYIKTDKKGVLGDIYLLKEIRNKVEEIQVMQPWKIAEIKLRVKYIQDRLNGLNVRADFLDRRFRSRMFLRQLIISIFFLIIGLPLFLYGIAHNFIQFKLTDFLVPKITKDIEYYAPIAVLIGLIFYPAFYSIFVSFTGEYFHLNAVEKIIYFISLPISGFFAFSFWRYLRHISHKWNYLFLMINDRKNMTDLQTQRNELRAMIFEK